MTIPSVRRRAKHYKTRTGCRNCRTRHLKCGEEKPICYRCARSGLSCPGYDRSTPPRTTLVSVQARPSVLVHPLDLLPRSMTYIERQHFHYFCHNTVHKIPGASWNASWEKYVVQIAVNEPAVMHAALSIAALDNGSDDFILEQSGNAMALTRNCIDRIASRNSSADLEPLLVTVLLLFFLEVMQAHDFQAGLHLRNGLRIIQETLGAQNRGDKASEHQITISGTPRSNMDHLVHTFVRLDLDLTIAIERCLYAAIDGKMPESFSSLDEAIIHLDVLSSQMERLFNDLHEWSMANLDDQTFQNTDPEMLHCLADALKRTVSLDTRPDLAKRIEQTRSNVRHWMGASSSLSMKPEQERLYILSQIEVFNLWYTISSHYDIFDVPDDHFELQFATIVLLAERYVDLHLPTKTSYTQACEKPGSAFSLGTGLVNCICNIAHRCRNSSIRRRCISLLQSIDLGGFFDTDYVVSLVQTLVNLEEESSRLVLGRAPGTDLESYEVPAECRILEIDLGGRQNTSTPMYYKADVGKLIYAYRDATGGVRVSSKTFSIARTRGGSYSKAQCYD